MARPQSEGLPRANDAVEKLTPQVKAGLAHASAALSTASPGRGHRPHKVSTTYVPAASGRLAPVAGQASKVAHNAKVSPAVENALMNLTGDKKAVKKLRRPPRSTPRAQRSS